MRYFKNIPNTIQQIKIFSIAFRKVRRLLHTFENKYYFSRFVLLRLDRLSRNLKYLK